VLRALRETLAHPADPRTIARLGFLLIGLAVVGVGVVLALDLRRAGGEVRQMHAGAMQGLDLIAELQYQTQEARRSVLYALTTDDSNRQVVYADDSRAADARVARLTSEHSDLLESPRGRQALERFSADWTAYLLVRDEVIASILEGSIKEAVERDLRQGVAAFERVRGDLQEIKVLYKDQAERRAMGLEAAYNRSLLRLIVIIVLAQVLAVVAARAVQRSVVARAVADSEQRLREVIDSISEGMFVVDQEGRVQLWNRGAEAGAGRKREEVLGRPLLEALPEIADTPLAGALGASSATTSKIPLRLRRDGDERVLEASVFPFERGTTVFLNDVTLRRRAEDALRESEAKFRTLAESAASAIFIYQGNGFRYVNRGAEALTGYSREELLGLNFWEVVHPDHRELVRQRGMARQQGRAVSERYEFKVLTKHGEERWVDFTAALTEFGGQPAALGTAFDITDRKLAQELIHHQAYHDALTGLPNRMLLADRLNLALAHAHRQQGSLAVMFLDLDHFKLVNDTLGHSLGDRLLTALAERLKACVREDDTVARVGGDEFVLLLPGISRGEDAAKIAQKVLDYVSKPLLLDGHELFVTTSVGIGMYPSDGEETESLLKNADSAMYRAKEMGRNNYQLFTPAMNARAVLRLSLESGLRRGLERGEFALYYQPIVTLGSRSIAGVESLVRWRHPERGLIEPADFIPLAEDSRLILPLGQWVLEQACLQMRLWREAGLAPLRIAVNLSARQFQQRDLIRTVHQALKEARLSPASLELEITESAAMQNVDLTVGMLYGLREMGVRIAMDDFGTGHSSLSYLKRFPIDAIKIDQSFIRDMTVDPYDAAIVSGVVDMAHSLKLRVVAEGVESEEQAAFLRGLRCDEMQGYLFARPLPAEGLLEVLRAGPLARL
jgi:diguanylate cyclase (GGDEF)-like protein/PAS domain S-box-containing protein